MKVRSVMCWRLFRRNYDEAEGQLDEMSSRAAYP